MENHCLQTIAQVLVTYLSRTNDHSFSTINQL
jgi:hypothetical protein